MLHCRYSYAALFVPDSCTLCARYLHFAGTIFLLVLHDGFLESFDSFLESFDSFLINCCIPLH